MQSRLLAALLAAALSALALPAAAQDASASARGSVVVRELERTAMRVQFLLSTTRDAGDRERAMCVDGRLSELHSLLRLALERWDRMHDAEQRGDRDHADRERRLLRRLQDDARRLEANARACVDPEPALPSGITQVIVTIEPWVPDEDLSVIPSPTRSVFR